MRIYYPGSPDIPVGKQPNGKPWPVLRLDQLEAIARVRRAVADGVVADDGERYHSALVGAGMGSGKTVVSVEVIIKTNPERGLIVGVRDAYGQWAAALRDQQHAGNLTGPGATFGVKRKLLRVDNTPDGLTNLEYLLRGDPGLFYVGLEMLRSKDWETVSETKPTDPAVKAFFGDDIEDTIEVKERRQKMTYAKMPWVDLLISDESHKHSNSKTASIETIRTIRARAKVALSGTFFGNKFENAWSLCVWLWSRAVIGNKGEWESDWAVKKPIMSKDGKKQLTTKTNFPLTKIVGEKNPGEFVETLPCYVFIATPIGQPPEPEVVKIDLAPEQQRQYEEMETQSLTWIPTINSPGYEPLVADLPVTQRGRLRTAALGGMTLVPGKEEEDPDSITFQPGTPSSTLNAAYDVLHRPTWKGKKALILTHSKQFAIETARRIGKKYRVALKTGDTKPADWDVMKESFMQPVSETSIQYLVAVISAVGTATDGLQASCSHVLWLSEDDNNVNNIQAANRIWRDGVDLDSYEAVKIVQRGTIAEGVLTKNRTHKAMVLDSVAGSK